MDSINATQASGNTTESLYTASVQSKKKQEEETAQLQQQSLAAASLSTVAANTGTTGEQTAETTAVTAVSPAYSVEISQEGSRLNSATISAQAEENSTSETQNSASATNGTTAASSSSSKTDSASSSTTATSNEDSDSSSTSDLSQYSEAQLQQMLNKGEISQSEYNAEISKRQAKETANKAAGETDKASDVTELVK